MNNYNMSLYHHTPASYSFYLAGTGAYLTLRCMEAAVLTRGLQPIDRVDWHVYHEAPAIWSVWRIGLQSSTYSCLCAQEFMTSLVRTAEVVANC